jgi:hypothetical protein
MGTQAYRKIGIPEEEEEQGSRYKEEDHGIYTKEEGDTTTAKRVIYYGTSRDTSTRKANASDTSQESKKD